MPTMNYGSEAPTINVPPQHPEQPTANTGEETPLPMPGWMTDFVALAAAKRPTVNAAGEEAPLLMPVMQF